MAMAVKDILKRAQDTLQASETVRANYEAMCGLHLAYAYGNQWATISPGRRGGQNLQQLRTITRANNPNVRFAMNEIGSRIVKLDSVLKPKELASRAVPATRSNEDQIIALVADARLKHHLHDAKGKRTLRRASLWRLVLGSVVVRRTIASFGREIEVFDAEGKRSVNPKTNAPRRLRKFKHGWAVCAPYEFIRAPSAITLDFDDEDIIGHEKPRTVEWLKRKYNVVVETDTTIGQLLEFQRFLHTATGNTMNEGFSMSKAKGVMVSEWLLKDPDGNDEWDTWMLAFRKTRDENPENRKLQVIRVGPNPYSELPFHHFWYNPKINSPWGQSVPEITIQVQDATNIAYSMAIRAMIYHASPKWVVEKDSLVDKPEYALSNRADVPILFKRDRTPPDRLSPGNISPEVQHMLGSTSTWFDNLLNMAPVQSGVAVTRGEAALAYEVRRDAADTPLTAITDEDEMTVNELLTGTLYDISKTDSLKTLQDDLGGQFTLDQIALFKSADARKAISGVQVRPDSLRPRTPEQMRADAVDSVASQMIDPKTARRALLVKRIELDVKEARAYRRQLAEIQTILGGEQVDVYLGQDHETHMWTLSLEQESAEYPSYSEEQKLALQEHWTEHERQMTIRKQMDVEGPQLPQGAQGQQQPGQEGMGLLPGPVPDETFGGLEGAGGFAEPTSLGPEAFPPQPAIAGSIGPATGEQTPAAGQALGIG